MEQKLAMELIGGFPKKEYQVFELNGIKLDYFDIELALHGISAEILRYQRGVEEHPDWNNSRYNAMLHAAETKFQQILEKMDRPPEDEERPAGYVIKM